ncbi:30S ribosomal protein S27ae [Nanohaloarchaea archaeon]|jgi:small subunit ribosomal protein S27Ae|nr:30S ribosomal protein S27ae [Candidatus Nanohaloarchaea archaeon]
MGRNANVSLHEKYDEEGNLQAEKCPVCGSILAEHDDRKTCGKCGYTQR